MSYHNETYKRQVYKRWLENGQPWFSKDPSKDPTAEERKIILEMKKRENDKLKRELELEKRTQQFRQYEKRGKITDSIFDTVSRELGDY